AHEAIAPLDVGAAVHVVTDPACDGHEPRLQSGPILGIGRSGDIKDDAIDMPQGGLQVTYGLNRERVLGCQINAARRTMLEARGLIDEPAAIGRTVWNPGRASTGGELSRNAQQLGRQRKSRVARHHDAEMLAFDEVLELGKITALSQ